MSSTMSDTKVSLKLQKKSKGASTKRHAAVLPEFDNGTALADSLPVEDTINQSPLIIPVAENKTRWKRTEEAPEVSKEDLEAAQALQANGVQTTKRDEDLVIAVDVEYRQYKADVEDLPDELPLDSEGYQRVPIAQFGSALLRGMGWKGEDDNSKQTKSDDGELPRPHRLGLGATPLLNLDKLNTARKRGRRADEVKRHEALQEQQQEYVRQRERQKELDKQWTLQNGSIVWLRDGRRAKILQMVGVPGLNMVKVQCEGNLSATVVKRGEIGDLLSREELRDNPIREVSLQPSGEALQTAPDKPSSSTTWDARDVSGRTEKSSKRDRKESKGSERNDDRTSKRRKEDRYSEASRSHWLLTNIRVRVISEKLGKRYFKEKGIVVDVTPKGATLKMSDGQLIDRVPERYLETALPKPGGNAIVLTGSHRLSKGKLLERDSRAAKGVIQVFEDMNVLKLSLDDIAEWCGPLDDDLV